MTPTEKAIELAVRETLKLVGVSALKATSMFKSSKSRVDKKAA
jgi:hypothetical protein